MMKIPSSSPNHPLTESEILGAESLLGVKLPASYVELMRRWNGGPCDTHKITAKEWTEDLSQFLPNGVWTINAIYGISTDPDNFRAIMQTPYMVEEWGLPGPIVLLDGEGHTWVALDYRSEGEPKVIFIETDDGRTALLADSFAEFLQNLIPEE